MRPPRLFHVSGKSPLGTCHRGGTFYVLRLPQQTVVSRPERKFLAQWREWHMVGIMRRSHCHSPTANESAWYGSTTRPRLPNCGRSQVPDAMRHGVGFLRIAHPELSILRSQTEPTTRCFREKRAHEMHQIGLSQARIVASGLEVVATVPRIESLRIHLDPQTTAASADHHAKKATSPAIPCCRKEPPLGTCHRGGTFYVLRLPQQTAASSSGRKIFWAVARGTPRTNHAPQALSCPVRRRIGGAWRDGPRSRAVLGTNQLPEGDLPSRQGPYQRLVQSRPS